MTARFKSKAGVCSCHNDSLFLDAKTGCGMGEGDERGGNDIKNAVYSREKGHDED